MAGTNQIVPFAAGDGANTLDPATYASDPVVQTGFQAGVAKSIKFNTFARQVSTVAAAVAQFVVNETGTSVNDDGNVTNLAAQIASAIQAMLPNVPTATVHVGDDTSGAAGSIVATVVPTITSYTKDHIYLIAPANACSGATTANLNGAGSKNIVRNDGSALVSGDWLAAEPIVLAYDGTNLRLLSLTVPQINALIASSTSISTTVQNYIDKSSPRAATILKAFVAGAAVTDIAVTPATTTVLTSGSFTGASYIDVFASCAFRSRETSTNYIGYTARVQLNDLTSGTSYLADDYEGSGTQLGGTNQVQTAVSLRHIYQTLDPTHTYTVSILCQKSGNYGPIDIDDPRITGLHDGH